ncbi:MAG: FeoA family protein [Cyanobacteria bacterium P01_G01_bin.19]
MDDKPNNRQKKYRRHQGWQFTFCGGTSGTRRDEGNRTQLASESFQNNWKTEGLLPLSNTQVNDRVVITQILSGRSMIRRLSKMGLTLGSEIGVVSKANSGSVIVCIDDEQIGLGAGIAERVMVTFAAEST